MQQLFLNVMPKELWRKIQVVIGTEKRSVLPVRLMLASQDNNNNFDHWACAVFREAGCQNACIAQEICFIWVTWLSPFWPLTISGWPVISQLHLTLLPHIWSEAILRCHKYPSITCADRSCPTVAMSFHVLLSVWCSVGVCVKSSQCGHVCSRFVWFLCEKIIFELN